MNAHAGQLSIGQSYVDARQRTQAVSSERRQRHGLRAALVAGDILTVAGAFLIAYWIRFDLRMTVAPEVVPSPVFYEWLILTLVPVWLVLFALCGLYSWENLLGGVVEYQRVLNASSMGMILVAGATFFQPTFVVARGWLVGAWLLTVILTCISRFLIRRVAYLLRHRGYFLVPAVVVGSNGEALSLAHELMENSSSGYRVLGVVESKGNGAETKTGLQGSRLPMLGGSEDILQILAASGARELIVAASSIQQEELLALFERTQPLKDVTIQLSTGLYEVLTTGVRVKMASSIPLIQIDKCRLRPVEAAMKTALEYLVASLMLALAAPLMLLIAILVKLSSPGPVIHRRRVLSMGGREFDAFKFRTMYTDGQDYLDRRPELKHELRTQGKLKDDPRITPIGCWLRRYSLDELPQLVNVVRGEMSLVGPRMITAEEASKYGDHRANLLTVKPGITGLWQVSGRSELSYEQRVRLDMFYIRNYSIWRDMQILFVQTPGAVLRGRGAY